MFLPRVGLAMRTSWRLSTASGFQIRVESLLLTSGSAAAVCSMSLCWTRVVAWGVSTATRSFGGRLYPEGQRTHGCPSMARCRPFHPIQRHHLQRHGLLFLWRQWQQRRRVLRLTFAPLILRAPPLRYITPRDCWASRWSWCLITVLTSTVREHAVFFSHADKTSNFVDLFRSHADKTSNFVDLFYRANEHPWVQ